MATATPPAPERNIVGTAATVSLILLLAWQLAYWTWTFATPAAALSAPSAGENGVDLAVAARLFGGAASSSPGAASSSELRLKGVVAPTPGVAASAIFSTGTGKDVSIFIGSEVQPGVKLVEVNPDHAIVARAGVNERIDLEARKSTALSTAQPRAGGFKLNVSRASANNFSLSRKELDDALRDPNQLNYLGQIGVPAGGGGGMEPAPAGRLRPKVRLPPRDILQEVKRHAIGLP